jgi:hypothetical protein
MQGGLVLRPQIAAKPDQGPIKFFFHQGSVAELASDSVAAVGKT